MEVCEMTMRELIRSLNSTPALKARFEKFNQILREGSDAAHRGKGKLDSAGRGVGEGSVPPLPTGVR